MRWRASWGFAIGAAALRELDKLVWQKLSVSPVGSGDEGSRLRSSSGTKLPRRSDGMRKSDD